MSRKIIITGTLLCACITAALMSLYIIYARHTETTDIHDIPVISQSDGAYLLIDRIQDSNHVKTIYAAARDGSITYAFDNRVLGSGRDVYKNRELLLADKKSGIARVLRTYPLSFTPERDMANSAKYENSGIIAYLDTDISEQDRSLQIAVLFKDRNGRQYIYYPEETLYVN